RDNPKADWFVWADAKSDGTPPNNWLSVFGGTSWQWDTNRRQYYLHNFLAEQPDLNLHNPEVQDALLDSVRFWLDRGVDGFRLDTTNFYFHDSELRSNPPAEFIEESKLIEPYHYQNHLYDKNRPETVGFLQRLRSLLDRYPGSATVGEIGYGPRSLELMALYTSGNDKLHMAYTFDFLSAEFSAEFFRTRVQRFEEAAKDGWPCWAFSNHDVVRHVSRWHGHAPDQARLAKVMASLLLSLRGSVCLYQGEELGLTEAELAFEDLVDPYGIRLWPKSKGRDGARTPMVWERDDIYGGFTTGSQGRPWLPVQVDHLPKAVDVQSDNRGSVLAHYRRFLDLRRSHPALVKGSIEFLHAPADIIAFRRRWEGEEILCAFNLGASLATWDLPAGGAVEPVHGADFSGRVEGTRIVLDGMGAFLGRMK
ncbi:MAG TPA: alpha-amylase family glycosyl hydrolase, partial [Microvirga sp.]|nr:alpha-amylase family glycosyl hydrolase [Microvirga sp.]